MREGGRQGGLLRKTKERQRLGETGDRPERGIQRDWVWRDRDGGEGCGSQELECRSQAPSGVLRGELGSLSHRQGWRRALVLSGDSQYLLTVSQTSPKSLFLSLVISRVEGWPEQPPVAGEIPEQLGGRLQGVIFDRDTLRLQPVNTDWKEGDTPGSLPPTQLSSKC